MKILDAIACFSKIDFQEDTDYQIYPKSLYECPNCKNNISFNMQNFKKYSLNNESIFSTEIQEEIKRTIQMSHQKESNSFIDLYCPQCGLPTRIYFTTWAGGHFTGGYHLDFIVI
jgi:DNA-directed RNA polymerase subunit M/transcription elongation factor TFIIS